MKKFRKVQRYKPPHFSAIAFKANQAKNRYDAKSRNVEIFLEPLFIRMHENSITIKSLQLVIKKIMAVTEFFKR